MNKTSLNPKPGRPKANQHSLDIKQFNIKVSKAFGEAVRIIRQKYGVSQENLAYIAKIERAHMGRIERGEVNPTLAIIVRISTALKVSSSILMDEMERLLTESDSCSIKK